MGAARRGLKRTYPGSSPVSHAAECVRNVLAFFFFCLSKFVKAEQLPVYKSLEKEGIACLFALSICGHCSSCTGPCGAKAAAFLPSERPYVQGSAPSW